MDRLSLIIRGQNYFDVDNNNKKFDAHKIIQQQAL